MTSDPYFQFLCSLLPQETQGYLQESTDFEDSSHWAKFRAEVQSAVKNTPVYLS